MKRIAAWLLGSCCLLALPACDQSARKTREPAAGSTLAAVRAKGYVSCGATIGTVGFGAPDKDGYWRGLDIETCRAVAVAVLGDKDKARFVPLTGQQRLTALQSGEIDILPRTTTWTLSRDANGINFTTPNYFDYDGIMVRRAIGVTSAAQLDGASVCVQTGSTTEVAFTDLQHETAPNLKAVIFETTQATRQAFFSGRCDALISDASGLASVRASMASNPDDFIIFPANSKVSALTPSVRHNDDQWFDIVKWSFQAMLVAEQLGITQDNIDRMLASDDPNIRRFLGVEPGNGEALGLDERWAYRIVKQLGNYGEMFERNVGQGSPLKIERGSNRLSRDGGLMVPLSMN